MTREFVILPEFDKQWRELGLDDSILRELQEHLCAYPESGSIMEGTGGLRKLRWALEGRGKSGSIRTLYVDFAFYEKIYLITAFPKNLFKIFLLSTLQMQVPPFVNWYLTSFRNSSIVYDTFLAN